MFLSEFMGNVLPIYNLAESPGELWIRRESDLVQRPDLVDLQQTEGFRQSVPK
jgi:hypothetical protein